MAYLGIAPFEQTVRTVSTFTATASQTTFSPAGGYVLGYVDVYLNGIKLVAGDDFTATNALTVVLTLGASEGDVLETVAYFPTSLVGTTNINGGTINGTTIGATTASTGNFTDLAYTGTLSGGTGVVNLGSGQFYKASDGKVGVGTNNPALKLSVNGDLWQGNGSGVEIGRITNASGWYDFGGSANVNGAQMSHGGTLRFLTASTERMRVDSAGRVTTLFQPYFRAHNVNSASIAIAAGTPVQFTAVQDNIGSHYNGTSRFTAPVAGVYIFTINLFGISGSDRFGIAINGSLVSNPYVLNTRDSADSGSFIIRLNASDYVEVMAQYGTSQIYGSHSGWMGYLLG
jgi:hypothetical protein